MKSTQLKKKVLEELKKTPIVEVACSKAGVGRTAFYEWKKKDPTFATAVDEAFSSGKEFVSDVAEGQLLNAIKSGNLTAVTFWLRHHRDEYRARLELSGEIREVREALTDEEAGVLSQALRLAGFSSEQIDALIVDNQK